MVDSCKYMVTLANRKSKMTKIITNASTVPVLAERIDNLITTVGVNHQNIKADIQEIKNNTVGQINALENNKIDKAEINTLKIEADKLHKDHEDRIRLLESRVWKAIGALVVCQVIILPIILYLIFKQIN